MSVIEYGTFDVRSANLYGAAGEFQSQRSMDILDTLVRNGFNYITLVPWWYMDTPKSNVIYSHAIKSPTDEDILYIIKQARTRGLKVMFKPHVQVLDNSWRGAITPDDRAAWFDGYNSFIMHYAKLAQANGVELLAVGTELRSSTTPAYGGNYRSYWETVIANIRGVYFGLITYAANCSWGSGDEWECACLWDLVDILGYDVWVRHLPSGYASYTMDDILNSWYLTCFGWNMVRKICEQQAIYQKPVLFTEIGCTSYSGSLHAVTGHDGVPDQQVQADFIEGMHRACSLFSDRILGFCWWDVNKNLDEYYSFEGKIAESTFKDWNTRLQKSVVQYTTSKTILV